LCAGFVLARRGCPGAPSSVWLSLAAGAGAVAAGARGTACRVALAGAMLVLGAGWWSLRIAEPGAAWLPSRAGDGPALVRVEGVILDDLRAVEPARTPLDVPLAGGPRWRTRLAVGALIDDHEAATPARGVLRLSGGSAGPPALRPGQRIRITGEFEASPHPVNPGEPDRRVRDAQEGIAGDLRVVDLATAEPLAPGSTPAQVRSWWLGVRAGWRSTAQRLVLGPDPGPSAPGARARESRALLAALILGEEDPALSDLRGAFRRLGLVHILSISGFHLMVMALLALAVVRLAGDLGWVEPAIVGAIVLVYLIILPFNAPVWRAGLMILGLLAADALGRRYDPLSTLAWIAFGLLIWRPADAWSIGFQLSFGLVAVLMRFAPVAHERLWGLRLRGVVERAPVGWRAARARLLHELRSLTAANVLCAAASAPLVLYHTGLLSPVSVLAGLIAVFPIVLLMVAAYASVLVGLLVPPLAGATSAALGQLGGLAAGVVRALDAIPGGSLRAPPVSVAWALAATALVLFWFARGHWRHKGVWMVGAVLGLWLAAEAILGPRLASPAPLRIDTLAVGDGSCHLIRSGGQGVLWDCGSLTPGVGRVMVPRAVRALRAGRVPTVIVTHPNLDHFNGILDIAEPLGVREVIVGRAFLDDARSGRKPEAYFLDELARRGIQVRVAAAGDAIAIGEARLEFLSPTAGARFAEDNDMSLVALVTHPGTPASLLLCGDIEDAAIASLRQSHPGLHPAVMELPHHGSGRAAAIEWVRELSPGVVIQSTGPGRAGDPRWDPIRLAPGRRWLCTARDGAVWAELWATALAAGRSLP
jgi:competence protein ComEC